MTQPSGQASEAFYAALLDDDAERLYERAPCGYLSTTPDGSIVKVNETFLSLTGYQRADLLGKRTFADLLTAGGRIYHETHYAPMLRVDSRVREIALEIVCADRRRLPVLVNSVLDRDDAGRPVVIRTAVFDATERREYERELVRARQRAEQSEARAAALARTLQESFLPPSVPAIPGLDVAGVYRPAGAGDEVGGDFYDVYQVAEDDWAVFLGDVCGKGVEAAVVMSLTRHTLRALTVREDRPSHVLAEVNDVLRHSPGGRFCTVVLARLRRQDGTWVFTASCGGHPLPIAVAPGTPPRTIGRPGSVLGLFDTVTFHDVAEELAPGTAVVLYTDGVSEARRGGQWYGDDRIAAVIAGHPGSARELADRLLADVLAYQDGVPRDDIAIVVLRVPEADTPGS